MSVPPEKDCADCARSNIGIITALSEKSQKKAKKYYPATAVGSFLLADILLLM